MNQSFQPIGSVERERERERKRSSVPAHSPQCPMSDFSNFAFHWCCHFHISKTNIWNLGEFYYGIFIHEIIIWNLWKLYEILHVQKNSKKEVNMGKISPNVAACYRLVKRNLTGTITCNQYLEPLGYTLQQKLDSINQAEISIIISSMTSDFG